MKTQDRIFALFPIGTSVSVSSDDKEFDGIVVGYREDNDGTPLFTVRDMDDDCFDMEAHELTAKPSSNRAPFIVSIDDGFVEYSYDLEVSENYSIQEVWQTIQKAFAAPDCKQPKLRVNYISEHISHA